MAEADGACRGEVADDPETGVSMAALFQVGKYQEQSQLLDPHLEDIIKPLAAALREEAARADSADLDRVQAVSRLVEVRPGRPIPATPAAAAGLHPSEARLMRSLARRR